MLKRNHANKGQGLAQGQQSFALAALASAMLWTTAPVAMAQEGAGGAQLPQRFAMHTATALTLPQAVELALASHADVAAAKRLVEAMQGQVIQGGARPNPELAYALEDTRSATRSQSWQLNVPLELGGKRSARTRAAEKAREQALVQLADVQAAVRANVATAYWDALAAQERLALSQDSAALAKAATDTVAKRVAAGKVSPVEETKARVAEAGIRLELAQAASDERNAQTRLYALLGAPQASAFQLQGTGDALPPVPDFAALHLQAASAPAILLARAEVQRRQALTAVEQSKRVPDITLSAGVKRSNETQRNMVLLGVSVPIPVFDRNQGNLLEALQLEDKARDELQAATVRLGSELSQAHDRLSTITTEVRTLQADVLPGAKSAYDAATVGFENGKFSFLEVLDAQRTYFSAKSQYLKALAESHRAAADIDRLLGNALRTAFTPSSQ